MGLGREEERGRKRTAATARGAVRPGECVCVCVAVEGDGSRATVWLGGQYGGEGVGDKVFPFTSQCTYTRTCTAHRSTCLSRAHILTTCAPSFLHTHPLNTQIKLLQVLGLLGAGDRSASEHMYAVIADTMRRGNTGHTIGNAVVYECVRTISTIFPNPPLLQSGECAPHGGRGGWRGEGVLRHQRGGGVVVMVVRREEVR